MSHSVKPDIAKIARLAVDNFRNEIRKSMQPAIVNFMKEFPSPDDAEERGFIAEEIYQVTNTPKWMGALEIACTEVAIVAFEESCSGAFILEHCASHNGDVDAAAAGSKYRWFSDAENFLPDFATSFGNALSELISEIRRRGDAGNPVVSRRVGGDA